MLTCYKVYPLIERLQSQWEQLHNNPKYVPVKHALEAGLKNMSKWYHKTDDTSIYFISQSYFHFSITGSLKNPVLDPTCKLSYLKAVWDSEWIKAGKKQMQEIVSISI